MPNTPVTPEVRQNILDNLASTCETWIDDVMRSYFDQPDSSFALQMMLEAFAVAIGRTVNRPPEGPAILQTFIHELQDTLTRRAQ